MRKLNRLAIALTGLAAASAANAGIANGDFENPDVLNSGWSAYLSNGGMPWSSQGSVGSPFTYQVSAPAGTGTYVATLHTGQADDYQRLWQDFTVAGSGATLSALVNFYGFYSGDGYVDDGYFRVGLVGTGGEVATWMQDFNWDVLTSDGSTSWDTYSYTLGGPGTYRVEFGVRNVGDDDDMFATELRLDNVTVTPVPEPGEWSMMFLGLGVVGLMARRRKSA